MRKLFFFLILLIPFSVSALTYTTGLPNRYYGYFETLQYNDNNVMLSYYNNGWIDDDIQSGLKINGPSQSANYRIALSSYGICYSNSTDCYYSGINDSPFKFFEQDICVSSNKFSVEIANGSVQDFTSNKDPLILITENRCTLYDINDDYVSGGTIYWDWLGDYEGYVAKVFMPISNWHSLSDNNGNYFQAVSRLIITNNSLDFDLFYRFLTSGGLYDHSRYFEIDNSFTIDTMNFDATYEAIMDGVNVLDNQSHIVYQISKNLFDKSSLTGGWLGQNNQIYNQYTDTYGYTPFIKVEPNTTYTLNFYNSSNLGSAGINQYSSNDMSTLVSTQSENNRIITFTTTSNTHYVRFTVRLEAKDNVQLELGSFSTNYCPYGPTLDNNCVSNYVSVDIITWDENNLFNNIYNILNLPLKLTQFVVLGASGNCQPLRFTLFNSNIDVPCGNFFWNRSDVQDFRLVWNLLFGGFIIFRLVIWNIRVISSVLDPTSDSISVCLNLLDSDRKKGD